MASWEGAGNWREDFRHRHYPMYFRCRDGAGFLTVRTHAEYDRMAKGIDMIYLPCEASDLPVPPEAVEVFAAPSTTEDDPCATCGVMAAQHAGRKHPFKLQGTVAA